MKLSGVLWALAAAAAWGLVYTIDQKILREVSPIFLLFINSTITTLILGPLILAIRPDFQPLTDRTWWTLALTSLIIAALANIFIFASIKSIGAPTASVFEISYPLFVVVFSSLVYHKVPPLLFAFGTVLIIVGALLITASSSA
jgi:drug/metabolite transporter (DMT)-like permease